MTRKQELINKDDIKESDVCYEQSNEKIIFGNLEVDRKYRHNIKRLLRTMSKQRQQIR